MASSILRARGLSLDVSRPLVVGIANATTDSFSGGGRTPSAWVENALTCYEAGATIVEVGGESNVSNRPPVPPALEIENVVPVVEALVAAGAPVAVDTHRVETARAALAAGACIVNDISGLADPAMLALCAESGAAVVLMHTRTPPKTPLWDDALYADGVVDDVAAFFVERLEALGAAGVGGDRVVLDPGPDFAKTPRQTVEALRGLDRLAALGCPLMLAVSRKDFVGALTGRGPRDRLAGTLAAVGHGVDAGAHMLRVHDVAATADFLAVRAALNGELEVDPALQVDDALRWDQGPERREGR